MTGHRDGCDRTDRLVDRVVEDRVTPDDRAHAATCESCGPVLSRAMRFDDELRRSARGLVTEQLPYGVLDPDLAPRLVGGVLPMRHAAPGLASILAAVVILVVATSVAIAPGVLGPGTQPPHSGFQVSSPPFRSNTDIIQSAQALEYRCNPGRALPTTGPSARPGEREGGVCVSPKSIDSATAKIVPVENGDGEIVEVTVMGALYGPDTETSVDQLAAAMGQLTTLSIADPAVAAQAGRFVEETLPRLRVLPSGDDALMIYGDVRIFLQRYIAGGYRLVLQPA